MGYENSRQADLLATNCVVCGRKLCDAVSVEMGIGPECREKYGYNDECLAGARDEANHLVWELAARLTTKGGISEAEIAGLVGKIRDLGMGRLADRIAERVLKAYKMELRGDGSIAFISPYSPELVALLKAKVPSNARRWLGAERCWSIDARYAGAWRKQVEAEGHYLRVSREAEGRIAAAVTGPLPQAEPSQPQWSMKVEGGQTIHIHTPYNKEAVEALKIAAKGKARWDSATKCWTFDVSMGELVSEALRIYFPELSTAMDSDPTIRGASAAVKARDALAGAASLSADGPGSDVKAKIGALVPPGLSLYPYQEAGVAFIEVAAGRAYVGDVMGLGKTVQALMWLALHPEIVRTLVVVPASLVLNWEREAKKWLPGRTVSVVKNGKDPIQATEIVVTSYECVTRRKDEWMAWAPVAVVIDEAHYLKNQDAQRTKAMVGILPRKGKDGKMTEPVPGIATACQYVISLSGTPMLNRPIEIFTNLNLLCPADYPSFFRFAKRYCGAEKGQYGWDFGGATNTEELRSRLRDVMVRREKEQVLKELPPKRRAEVFVALSNADEYQVFEEDFLDKLTNPARKDERQKGDVLAALGQLRRMSGRGKVDAAIEWLTNADRPVVVFCHHLDVLGDIAQGLIKAEIAWVKVTGEMKVEDRQAAVDDFQAGRARVFLGTYGAASVGLTLTAASDTLHVERNWTPAIEEQAEDRCHRIGQTAESVTAWYMMSSASIDQKFASLVASKRAVLGEILGVAGQGGGEDLTSDLAEAMFGGALRAQVKGEQKP